MDGVTVAKRKITEEDLLKIIETRSRQSLNVEGEDLSDRRVKAQKLYRGDLVGDEQPGRSSYRSREVFETVEWLLPSLIRLFLSSHRPLEFLPRTLADRDAARQETDLTNYWLFERNNGFLVLHNWFKSALLYPNAYLKTMFDERTSVEEVTYTGINAEGVAALAEEAHGNTALEILDWAEAGVAAIPAVGPEGVTTKQVPLYDVQVRRTTRERSIVCAHVPPEEMRVDRTWHSLDLDDCPYVAHERTVTRSELIEQGFKPADLEGLTPSDRTSGPDGSTYGSEKNERYDTSDEDPLMPYDALAGDEASTVYDACEAYIKVDFDGDGVAERRRVYVVGGEILENEVCMDMPFIALSSILMPDRHVGMSIAEAVADLQRLSTALHRQLLNSIYSVNVRRTFVSKNALTQDGKTEKLLHDPSARLIPVEGDPHAAVMPDPTPSVLGDILPMLDQVDQRRKIRSGVAPEASLDPEVLKETTAHAYLGAQEAASQRIELIARVFAETGMKKLYMKIHELLRRHFDQELAVELRGEWVQVNPSKWSKRTDMRVCVGLGYNGSMQTTSALLQVFGLQQQLTPTGLSKPINMYRTLEKLVESMNVGHAPEFFISPDSPTFQPPPPPPDPALIAAQAAMADAQNKLQASVAKTQMDAQSAALNAKIQREAKDVELELKAAELRLKELEIAAKTYETSHKAAIEVQRERANVQQSLAQGTALLAQAAYSQAMAEKTALEANVSTRKIESEIELNDAKAESEEQKAEKPAEEKKTDD